MVTTDGAAWSWDELFDQFAPTIHALARSRGVSSPEDIVQDVFATAVERFPRFDGDSSGLRSFLFTLVYRRIADEHRITHRRPERLVADHPHTPDERPGIEDSIADIESAREAMKALEILGEKERRVIEMRIIDEASPAEVAEALGLSNGNVRVIQARSLMKIRKYLESKSGSLPSISLVLAFFESLRSELPVDGGLAAWVETIRSETAVGTAKTAAAAGPAIAAGTASTATIAGTVLKVGLVVALATGSTSSTEPVSPDRLGDLQPPPVVAPAMGRIVSTDLTVPRAVVDDPTPAIAVAPSASLNRHAPAAPTRDETEEAQPARDETEEAQPTRATEAETEVDVSNPDTGDGTQPIGDHPVEPVVSEPVEPVIDEVSAVVDDVVETVEEVVEEVVGVVEEGVAVVEETVEEVVTVVEEVADGVVEVVDETTQTANETVESVVDDLTDGLGLGNNSGGGLLG